MGMDLLRATFDSVVVPTRIDTTEEAAALREIYSERILGCSLEKLNPSSLLCLEYNNDGDLFSNGQTGFFRHHHMLELIPTSLQEASKDKTRPIRVLAPPPSIGAETFQTAAHFIVAGLTKKRDVRIDTFDRSKLFTSLARLGAYPSEMTVKPHRKLGKLHKAIFAPPQIEGATAVNPEVKNRVRIMDARSFEDFKPDEQYDALIINNLFKYLNAAQRGKAIDVIGSVQADIVITTRDFLDPDNAMKGMGYIPFKEHSTWKNTSLAKLPERHDWYYIWARNKPSANYA